MSDGFLASWSLFGTTYAVGMLSAFVLGLVGVWVVARDQIFLGAAVSQASTLGVAIALWLGGADVMAHTGWLQGELAPALLAVTASVVTAWVAGGETAGSRESGDAVNGWVFLLASSVPILLVAHSPHGTEEIERLAFSTLLSVSRVDLVGFVVLAILGVTCAAWWRDRLILLAVDPVVAVAVGLRHERWRLGIAVALGSAVGLSIHTGGMLYSFGCLVLPALVAKNLCREIRPMIALSPLIAVAASLAGFVVAHDRDWPPAHTTVALLAAALPVAWMLRAWRDRRAAGSSGVHTGRRTPRPSSPGVSKAPVDGSGT